MVMAACQQPLLKALAKTCYSFIYGMNTKQICKRFMDYMPLDPVAISIDGSGFDSTQHDDLIKCVDHEFLNRCKPYFDNFF